MPVKRYQAASTNRPPHHLDCLQGIATLGHRDDVPACPDTNAFNHAQRGDLDRLAAVATIYRRNPLARRYHLFVWRGTHHNGVAERKRRIGDNA